MKMYWTDTERLDMASFIYAFCYECNLGYEDDCPYDTAEKAIKIYKDLGDPYTAKKIILGIIDWLQDDMLYPAKQQTSPFLADEQYVRIHRENGLSIIKEIMEHMLEEE